VVRLLLDTHTFLWFLSADPQLSATARTLIEDGDNEVYLSVGSLWEMAIKIGLGKLSLGRPYETFIPDQLARTGIDLLTITFGHTARVLTLPSHHRDPFDRLLIAQALVEGLSIVGVDAAFDAYGVARLW